MNGELMTAGGLGGNEVTQYGAERGAALVQAELQSMMMWAVKFPRNEDAAIEHVLKLAEDPTFADKAVYRLERKNYHTGEVKVIYGLTIDCAEEFKRNWKNLRIDTNVLSETYDNMLLEVVNYDLEKNIRDTEPVFVSKTVERAKLRPGEVAIRERTNSQGKLSFTVRASDGDLRNQLLSLTHRAKRNVIFADIPAWAKEKVLAKCMETNEKEAERQSKTKEGREKIVKSFGEQGVTREQIEKYLTHPIEQVTTKEWQALRGIYQAIAREGMTWAEATEQGSGEDRPGKPEPERGRMTDTDMKAGDASTHQAVDAKLDPQAETPQPTPKSKAASKVKTSDGCVAAWKEFIDEQALSESEIDFVTNKLMLTRWATDNPEAINEDPKAFAKWLKEEVVPKLQQRTIAD